MTNTDTSLAAPWALRWAELAQQTISANRSQLGELDRAIGDGDHGDNMDRGFSAVGEKLAGSEAEDLSAVLKTVATTLMSTVGGAAGPLYGTAFLRAATSATGSHLEGAGVATMLEAAVGGLEMRGKAGTGEKTMIDAWAPAAAAARRTAEVGGGAVAALVAAADAAVAGAEATEPMVATKGRASYLGERSAGHRDPGAQSSALLLRCAAQAAQQQQPDNGGNEGPGLGQGSDAASPEGG